MSEQAPSRFALALIPALVAIAIGWGGRHGEFVRDDLDYISGNPHVACGVSPWVAWNSPFQPLKTLGLWRPLTTVTLAFDARIAESTGDSSPTWPFHLTNLLLAGVAAGATALLAFRLGVHANWSSFAGLLVAVHPARTEAVLWISGRAECLMTACVLLALLTALNPSNLRRDLALAAWSFLACSSKEQGFVLPALVALLPFASHRERLRTLIPVVVATMLAFAWRTAVMGPPVLAEGMSVLPGVEFADRVRYGLSFLSDYIVAGWVPRVLAEYDEPRSIPPLHTMVPTLLMVGALISFVIFIRRSALTMNRRDQSNASPLQHSRDWIFGWWLFFIPLIPVLNIFIKTGEHFAERFLALPLCGLALQLGLMLTAFNSTLSRKATTHFMVRVLAVIVLVFYAWSSFRRIQDWDSPDAIVTSLMRDAPHSASAPFLASAQALEPTDPRRKRDAEAGRLFLRQAIERDRNHIGARTALAILDAQEADRSGNQQKLQQTRAFLEETLELAPACDQIRGTLGLIAKAQGDTKTAIAMLEAEMLRMPAHLAWALPLAELLEERGDRLAAAQVRTKVAEAMRAQWRIEPGFAPIAASYIWALAEPLGQPDEAARALETSLAHATVPRMRTQLEGLRTALRERGSLPK